MNKSDKIKSEGKKTNEREQENKVEKEWNRRKERKCFKTWFSQNILVDFKTFNQNVFLKNAMNLNFHD